MAARTGQGHTQAVGGGKRQVRRAGPTRPAGTGATCCPSTTSGRGTRSYRWSAIIANAPPDDLLGGLEQQHHSVPAPFRALPPGRGRAHQARHVHVVTAGVHDRHVPPVRVRGAHRARVGQTRGLGNGQRVHVGPQQDHPPLTSPQDTGHACSADPLRHRETPTPEPVGSNPGRPVLGEGELGVTVEVAIDLLEAGKQIFARDGRHYGDARAAQAYMALPSSTRADLRAGR